MNIKKIWKKKFIFLILLFLPLFTVMWILLLRNASGPFWLGYNLDPDYAYLLNSLSLSQRGSVGHADHPGSTLQLFGGGVLFLFDLFSQHDAIIAVLSDPEFFLKYLQYLIICLLFLTQFIVGFFIYKWLKDIMAALLVQSGILTSFTSRNVLADFKPEPLLLVFSIWMTLVIIYHTYSLNNKSAKEPFWQYGIISGMALALKITFIPLFFLPLFLLKKMSFRIYYLITTSIVFLILAANPRMQFETFVNFFKILIKREGYNAPSIPTSNLFQGMIDGMILFFNLIIKYEIILFIIIIIFLIIGIRIYTYKGKNTLNYFSFRLWLALIFTLFIQILIVINGPKAHLHYFVPFLGLIGLLLLFIWQYIFGILNNQIYLKLITIFFLLIFIVFSIYIAPKELKGIKTLSKQWKEALQYKNEKKLMNELFLYYYRASDPKFALAFGNEFTYRRFSKSLSKIYPQFYYYHIWHQKVYRDFERNPINMIELLEHHKTIYIQGDKNPKRVTNLEAFLLDIQKRALKRGFIVQTELIFNGSVEQIIKLILKVNSNSISN